MIIIDHRYSTFLDGLFDFMVPENHKLRKLRENLDFSFVAELCASYYKNDDTGRPAESPEKLFRMLFLMIFEGIPGETRLVERISTDVAYRFFCGFHIDDRIPDHSTLWAFRKRVGVDFFQHVMARILEQCIEKGLVSGDRLMFDCTNTNARGTPYSKYHQALILAKALEEKYRSMAIEADDDGNPFDSQDLRKLIAKIASEVTEYKNPDLIERKIREEAASNPSLFDVAANPDDDNNPDNSPGGGNPVSLPNEKTLKADAEGIRATLPHTAGDPSARCGHTSTHKNFTGYMNGVLTDDKHQVVVSVAIYPGNVCQKDTAVDAMRFYAKNVVPMLKGTGKEFTNPEIVMDSAFDYSEVYKTAKEWGLNAITSLRKRPSKKDLYDTDYFKMDETGQLRCPTGNTMSRSQKTDSQGRYSYCGGAMCRDCSVRKNCTKSKKGRTVLLNPALKLQRQEQLVKAGDGEYRETLRKRMVIEGIFGTGKTYHHLGKALYRSAGMVNIQILMWATVHNSGKLHRYGNGVTSVPVKSTLPLFGHTSESSSGFGPGSVAASVSGSVQAFAA